MKKLTWLVLAISATWLLSAGNAYAKKVSQQDRAAIETVVNNYMAAYNKMDEEAIQKLFAQDGDLLTSDRSIFNEGQAAVIAEIKQAKRENLKGRDMSVNIARMQEISKGIYFVEAKGILKSTTPSGTPLPTINNRMVMLLEKEGKDLKIDSVRYYSNVPSGATAPVKKF